VLPTESAVVVPIPEAENAVGRFRAQLDESATWGVPPHVTILYPFVHPDRIDDQVLASLAEGIRTVSATRIVLTRVDWFGEQVAWLAPEPDRPFRDLMKAVCSRFPDCPPYGGGHPDPTPHLTIGADGPLSDLRAAAKAVEVHLPIAVDVTTAHLICGSQEPHSWHTVAEIPLAQASPPGH
jgi:2'-5' RNA ligase